jgi:hypothetical protein
MLSFCRGYDGAVNGSETDGSDLMDAGKKGAYPASVLENKRMIIFFQEQMRNALMIQTPEQRVSNLTQP